MNDELTEGRKRDHAVPNNERETVSLRNNFTLHKSNSFGEPNIGTKSYSILATWKSLPSRKPDIKRDSQRCHFTESPEVE